MTVAQLALDEINKLDHPFTQSFVVDALAKRIKGLNDSGRTDKQMATDVTKNTSGMVDGEAWVKSIREVEQVLVKYNLIKK